jgi:hypothetical protein
MVKNRALSRWAAAAFLVLVIAACTAADEGSWRDRPSSYSAYGGRGGVPSGGGP